MTAFLKFFFHFAILFLIIISLFPGSLLGLFFYGDISQQPNLVENAFGMFFLSIALEAFHLIIPNRSFQFGDLIGNILGVLLAYFLVKIYLYFIKL